MSEHQADGHRRQMDGLRFLAFLAVFVFHAYGPAFADGALGVQLFFALSGFLITRIIVLNESGSPRRDLGVFYARRVLRIFPLYYGVLTVFLLLGMLPHPVWHYLYAQNFLMFSQNQYVGPPHFWSLCVEEQFYLTYPLLLLLIPRSLRFLGVFVLLGLSITASVLLDLLYPGNMNGVLLPTSAQYLLWGGAAGLLDLSRVAGKFPATPGFASATGLLFAALCLRHTSAGHLPGALYGLDAVIGLSFSLVVLGLWRTKNAAVLRLFRLAPLAYLGKISYGLYVYHVFSFHVSKYLVHTLPVPGLWRVHVVLSFLITVAMAAASWHFFESPLNDLKRYFPYRRRARPVLASGFAPAAPSPPGVPAAPGAEGGGVLKEAGVTG